MNRGFWDNLPQPFWLLAPMYDVTDAAFRSIIFKTGRPHVFFTEFTSTDGLQSAGKDRLMHHLEFHPNQEPTVAQIFGAHPEKFFATAQLLSALGFSGIDINMGCPDKAVMKQGSCAALFKNHKLAQQIILATKQGSNGLPVSVKIRIGDTNINWEPWIGALLETEPAAISIHLRTRKEMSKVPAHWEELPKIVNFIHQHTTPHTRPYVIGNGDVETLAQAREKVRESGCDGIMIGRGILKNPWLFDETVNPENITAKDRLDLLLKHVGLFEQAFQNKKPFDVLKRFFKIYAQGFTGAAELREELYKTKSVEEVKHTIIANSQLLISNTNE